MENELCDLYNETMTLPVSLTEFPAVLSLTHDGLARRYLKHPELIAVHNVDLSTETTGVELILDDSIAICRKIPPSLANHPSPLTITPVYQAAPHGPLAVPTGRIFVRCSPDLRLEDRRTDLAARGYELTEIPSYAPHTGWVQSATGDMASSLKNFERLKTLPGIVHVQPQLLMPRTARS
ncbi:MAG: hypothetical protein AB7P24_13495 [Nitrospira sp.]